MYRYAIIGFGGLAKIHFSNLMKLEKERGDFILCAICGTDPESFQKNVSLNLGDVDMSSFDFSGCNFYTDYKELMEKEKPDFVLSTLPTFLHEEVAVYCLNHGAHVFSEKPMARTQEQCKNMAKAAEVNGKKLMIGQCLRFDPACAKVKEYIEKQTFGKAYRAEFSRYSQLPIWSWNNWLLKPDMGGGCVMDMDVHDVHLINWFFGKPSSLRSVVTRQKEDLESMFTQYFYDDLLIIANADWSMPQTFPFESRFLINFAEATVVLQGGTLTVYQDDRSFSPKLSGTDYFMDEMRAFLHWVIDDVPCECITIESVAQTIDLVLKELESAKTGERVHF